MSPNPSMRWPALQSRVQARVLAMARGRKSGAPPDARRAAEAAAEAAAALPHAPDFGAAAERMWGTPAGSMALQNAIRRVYRHEVIRAVAKATRGKVAGMLECPHAHHLVQALIVALPPASVSFFLPELQAAGWTGVAMAKHRFGCRVLERMLEHFSGSPEHEALMAFLQLEEHMGELCLHSYGNFVVQHVVEHGHIAQKFAVYMHVSEHLAELAVHSTGACVLDTVLAMAPACLRQALAAELVGDGSLVRGLLAEENRCEFQRNLEFMVQRVIFAASERLMEEPAIWDAIPATHRLRAVLDKRYALSQRGAVRPAEPMELRISAAAAPAELLDF